MEPTKQQSQELEKLIAQEQEWMNNPAVISEFDKKLEKV